MGKIKEILIRYKWIVVGGLSVAILTGTAMANIHIFQLINYKIQADTPAIITLMEEELKGLKNQDSWYFSEGMEYLLEEMSEESKQFFEEHFTEFDKGFQESIIAAYNTRNLFFKNQSVLTAAILDGLDDTAFAGYFKRMDEISVDQMLANYFGEAPTLDKAFIDQLYQIANIYPKQFILDKFGFDVYGLLVMEEESATQEEVVEDTTGNESIDTETKEIEASSTEDESISTVSESEQTQQIVSLMDKKNKIFSKLAPEKARDIIFNKLKVNPIQVETLKDLMEFLNRNKILEVKTATSFNSLYGEIGVIRKQYADIDTQEVELKNKKEAIELKISEPLKNIESKNIELSKAQEAVNHVESQLENLTGYAYMALYIEKAYGNGEYEASIPTTGLFGNFRPSSQKYIIKLTSSQFTTPGVYYVNITLQGTKVNKKGNEYPYYVEVSQSQLNEIETLQAEREAKVAAVNKIKSEIATIEAKIAAIKEEGGYSDIEAQLKQLVLQRESYIEKLNEKAVEIQNLLNIGRVIVQM